MRSLCGVGEVWGTGMVEVSGEGWSVWRVSHLMAGMGMYVVVMALEGLYSTVVVVFAAAVLSFLMAQMKLSLRLRWRR